VTSVIELVIIALPVALTSWGFWHLLGQYAALVLLVVTLAALMAKVQRIQRQDSPRNLGR